MRLVMSRSESQRGETVSKLRSEQVFYIFVMKCVDRAQMSIGIHAYIPKSCRTSTKRQHFSDVGQKLTSGAF